MPIGRQWIFLVAGLVLLGSAWVTTQFGERSLVELRIALLVVGLVTTYAALVQRLRRMTWDFPDRLESAAMVSVSIIGAVAGMSAMEPEWTSGRIFFGGLFGLTLVGALLILLPSLARRIALSLIIVFHFGGILTAVTVADQATTPWISNFMMAWVYRPYLHLIFMSNAYRFYSPDPGTSSVLRFAVFYNDGEFRWIEVPKKADCRIGMEYQRMNALPEQSFFSYYRFPPTEAELQGVPQEERPLHGSWDEISRRRQYESPFGYGPNKKPIPLVGDLAPIMQYQQPTDVSQGQIASLARHIWYMPEAQREGLTITSVKVYRVKINVLTPYELSKGRKPFDPTKQYSYFLGEFDKEGTLLHPKDPFLYWLLPIVRVSPNFPAGGAGLPYVNVLVDPPKDSILLDCLEMHASTPSPPEQKEPK